MTITSDELQGFELVMLGQDLDETDPNPLVDAFRIIDPVTGKYFDGILPLPVNLNALRDAANAGSGPITPENYPSFFFTLMPDLFFQLIYTGSRFAEFVRASMAMTSSSWEAATTATALAMARTSSTAPAARMTRLPARG